VPCGYSPLLDIVQVNLFAHPPVMWTSGNSLLRGGLYHRDALVPHLGPTPKSSSPSPLRSLAEPVDRHPRQAAHRRKGRTREVPGHPHHRSHCADNPLRSYSPSSAAIGSKTVMAVIVPRLTHAHPIVRSAREDLRG
jgi:hypothetical protein